MEKKRYSVRVGSGRSNPLVAVINGVVLLLSPVAMELVQALMWSVRRVLMFFIRFLMAINKTIKLTMTYIPQLISGFIPKKTTSTMTQSLIYAGVEMTAEEVVSITLVYSVVVTVIAYLIALVLNASQFVTAIVVVVSFAAVWMLPLVLLSMLTANRTNAVEDSLPDVLSMVAQNMKAGMTSYNALWSAARPEFGPLAIEIQNVAKATLTGIPLTDALVSMTNHVKSQKLPRSVRLIVQGMKSGGDLPAVLHAITTDMRKESNLKKAMAAETGAHSIFILFAIMVGAPLLFSVSFQFISIFSAMMTKLNVAELAKNAPKSMISLSELSITPDFFMTYSIAILIVSGFFGALLIGILKTGSITEGIPSMPAYVVIPIVIYFVMKFLLGMVFGSMIQF
jgi:Flp pilus assembly protein TadB